MRRFLLIFFLLLKILFIENQTNVDHKIFSQFLFKNQFNCIYLAYNIINELKGVEESLMKSESSTIIVRNETVNFFEDAFYCINYVLIANDFSAIKSVLNKYETRIKSHRSFFIIVKKGQKEDKIYLRNYGISNGLVITYVYIKSNAIVYKKIIKHWNIKSYFEMNQNPFQIYAFDIYPYLIVDKKGKICNGVDHKILSHILSNISYTYVLPKNKTKNLWTLGLDYVKEKKVNVAVGSHWIIKINRGEIDHTYPYSESCLSLLIPKPNLLSRVCFVFHPLQLTLWESIAAILLLNMLICYILSGKIIKLNYTIEDPIKIYLYLLQVATLNSLNRFVHIKGPFKIIIVSWSVVCLLLSTAYSGGFTSSLTYPRLSKPINTLQDLIDSNIRIVTFPGDIKNDFATSSNRLLRRLSDSINFSEDSKDINEKLETGNYATKVVILGKNSLMEIEYLNEYNRRRLRVMKDCFSQYSVVMALSKNSPFTEVFNKELSRLLEHGFIKFWFEDMKKYSKFNFDLFYELYSFYEIELRKPLGIENLQGIFLLLVLGFSISFCLFVLEITYCKCKK